VRYWLVPPVVIAGVLAGLALCCYAFVCMLNTSERTQLGIWFGLTFAAGAICVFLPADTSRMRRWSALPAVLIGLANIVMILLRHGRTSLPGLGAFLPLLCVVMFAGLITGMVLGVTLRHES
jgi:hypothetical protein